jgi:tetratricopeptide (TPR) repeat protein
MHAASPPKPEADALPVAIPLGRLPAEVRGRNSLLAELRQALGQGRDMHGSTWVLAGMGGLGKSTVALATAEAARSRGWRVWWVSATDPASLAGGMLEVLRQLHAPESVSQLVREGAPTAADRAWEFLNGSHEAKKKWLLILDNADSPAVLAAHDSLDPADYTGWLRPNPSGMVVVTTRTKDPQYWGSQVAMRELRPLDDVDAAKVLADLAPATADPGGLQARELGHRLGGLPLALHLAGCYLASPFARWHSFAEYRHALDSVELPAALADLDAPGSDARTTIQRTWDLSLNALSLEGHPQARWLLLLLSCFAAPTPIPLSLLQPAQLTCLLAAGTDPAALADNNEAELARRLSTSLRSLAAVGLIDIADNRGSPAERAVTVHPVVADANRSRLCTTAHSDLIMVGGSAVRSLQFATSTLDTGLPSDWPTWRLIFSHAAALVEWLSGYLETQVLVTLLDLSGATATALARSGNFVAAEKLAHSSLAAAARLGRDHPASLAARSSLAQAIVGQGRNREAEEHYHQLLVDEEEVLGKDHPDTVTTRHRLALIARFHGRYREAEDMFRALLPDEQQILGHDHAETMNTRNQIAELIGQRGRYLEAEKLFRKLLADEHQLLGNYHVETLSTRHDIALMAGKQGRYLEAEQQWRDLLDEQRTIFGDDHPAILVIRSSLAWLSSSSGRYKEAEQMNRELLDDRRRILGENHPATLRTQQRLALTIGLQGRHSEAERLGRQVLACQQRVLGHDHPFTLATRHDLAQAAADQGRLEEAEDMYRSLLADQQRLLGPDHPSHLVTWHALALAIDRQGRRGEAKEILSRVSADRKRVLGVEHPDTKQVDEDLALLTPGRGAHIAPAGRYD